MGKGYKLCLRKKTIGRMEIRSLDKIKFREVLFEYLKNLTFGSDVRRTPRS